MHTASAGACTAARVICQQAGMCCACCALLQPSPMLLPPWLFRRPNAIPMLMQLRSHICWEVGLQVVG